MGRKKKDINKKRKLKLSEATLAAGWRYNSVFDIDSFESKC